MAKGDNKRVRQAVETQRGKQTSQQEGLRNEFQSQYNFYNDADKDLRNQIQSGYQNFNPSELLEKYGYGSGGSVSGGIDPSKIDQFGKDPYAGYKNFSEGRGLTPEFWEGFNKSMGGMDTANESYKNFIGTGGFSPEELQAMRARGEAGVSSVFKSGQDNLNRQAAISGSTGNLGARQAKMTRDMAQQIGRTGIENEANIAQMVQQGKQFGTSGLSAGSAQQAQIRSQVQQLDAELRLQGLGGMTDIEKTRLEAELQNAQLNQSASSANSSRSNANAQFLASMDLARLGGMQDLYSSAPGATGQASQLQLALQQLAQSGNSQNINDQISGSQIPGNFQQALGNIGGVMNLAGSVMNPLGSILGGGKSNKGSAPIASPYGPTRLGSMPSNNLFSR